MKLLAALLICTACFAQSPTQHVTQGGLEVWTMVYTDLPPGLVDACGTDIIGAVCLDVHYGLSVLVKPTDSAIAGYRIQVQVVYEDALVYMVDELWTATGNDGCTWARVAIRTNHKPVRISGLIITPVIPKPAVEIPLL